MYCKNPSGTSSGALGRRDFVRPEFIAMLYDAGGPRGSYESRAGLLTFVRKKNFYCRVPRGRFARIRLVQPQEAHAATAAS